VLKYGKVTSHHLRKNKKSIFKSNGRRDRTTFQAT